MNPHQGWGHYGPSDRINPWTSRLAALAGQPFAATTMASIGLLAAAVVGLVALTLADATVNLADVALRLSATGITIAVVLLVYVSLRRKGRSIEEAYRLGNDIGFEAGYRAGREARDPVNTGLHPDVVDILQEEAVNAGDVVPMKRRRGALG